MTKELTAAYRAVIHDLEARSREAQSATRVNPRYVQSIENARAILVREAGLEEA